MFAAVFGNTTVATVFNQGAEFYVLCDYININVLY